MLVPEKQIRASLVIPTLNEGRLIGSLLDSFTSDLRQRLGLEVIVSDGGSTDGTIETAREKADRVVVHDEPSRQTISMGRNAGAWLATGQVLLFMNADVRLPDDPDSFLEAMISAAYDAGAATCRVGVHPDESTLMDRLVLGGCNILFRTMNLIGIGMGRGECHVVRTSVFRAVNGYDESLVAGEDFELYWRISRWGRRTRTAKIRFLWDQIIWEDPRRYRQKGYFRTLLAWFGNTVSVIFLGRAHSREWEVVR